MYRFTVFSTSMQVQSRSKLMPAMYYALNYPSYQVIYANGSRKLFRFRVRQFSGLN